MNSNSRRNKAAVTVCRAALIAAAYVALTFVSRLAGLDSGVIQLRVSEALTVLPAFTFSAVPGLFVGCLISNLLVGCPVWDILLGSAATLLGALGTYLLTRRCVWLAPLPPILANTAVIPFVLSFVYGAPEAINLLMLTVFAGEFCACGVLGTLLTAVLRKKARFLFGEKR